MSGAAATARTRCLLVAVLLSTSTLAGAGGATAGATTPPDAPTSAVVAADAPRVVRVGAAVTSVPTTALTSEPVDGTSVLLLGDGGELVGDGLATTPEVGRPTVFKPAVAVRSADVRAWGAHEWTFSTVDDGVTGPASTVVPVELRAHSLLGMAVSRRGDRLVVRGSARAYHNGVDRYVPWSGRPVSVQVLAGQAGWLQVTGARTDARGDLEVVVDLPPDAWVRLVTPDAPGTWGAVSRVAIL